MKQPVVAPLTCPINWTGFYIGVHLGYGWSNNSDTDVTPLPTAAQFVNLAPTTLSPDPNGIIGGAQMGYNWQSGHFVVGIETDFSGSAMNGRETLSPIIQNNGTPFPGAGNFVTARQDLNWFGTLRLRAGFTPTCRLLVYATGGLAYGNVDYSANTDFRPIGTEQYPASFSKTKAGWTVGGGLEYALTQKWSVKAEYLYVDLGSESATASPVPPLPPFGVRYNWQTTAHTVNVGLNYKF